MLKEGFAPVASRKKSNFEIVKPRRKETAGPARERGYVATMTENGLIRLNTNASEVFKENDGYFLSFVDRKAQKIMLQPTLADNPNAVKTSRTSRRDSKAITFSRSLLTDALPDYPQLDTKNFSYKFLIERDYEQEIPTLIIDFSEPLKVTARRRVNNA